MSELVQFEMPEVKLPTWDELMTTLSWKKNGFEVHYRATEETKKFARTINSATNKRNTKRNKKRVVQKLHL